MSSIQMLMENLLIHTLLRYALYILHVVAMTYYCITNLKARDLKSLSLAIECGCIDQLWLMKF